MTSWAFLIGGNGTVMNALKPQINQRLFPALKGTCTDSRVCGDHVFTPLFPQLHEHDDNLPPLAEVIGLLTLGGTNWMHFKERRLASGYLVPRLDLERSNFDMVFADEGGRRCKHGRASSVSVSSSAQQRPNLSES